MTTYQNYGWPRPKQSLFGQWTPHSNEGTRYNAVKGGIQLTETDGSLLQTITDNTITTNSIANYVMNTAAIGIFGSKTAQKEASSYFLSMSIRNPEPVQVEQYTQPAYREQYHAVNPGFALSQGLY